VLDHNFPYQVVHGLDWPPYLRLSALTAACQILDPVVSSWSCGPKGGAGGIDTQEKRCKDVAPHLVDEPDDWRILLALAVRGDVDGYITNDDTMLSTAAEMVALTRTRLALVMTAGVGHNPLRASGLLMTYLSEIAKQVLNQMPRRAVIFRLSAAPLGNFRLTPGQRLDVLAARKRMSPQELIAETLRKIGM